MKRVIFLFVMIIGIASVIFKYHSRLDSHANEKKKQTIKRKQFGVMPVMYCDDFSGSNLCGIEKNCYFIEKDARLDYLKFNYIIIKKIVDRRHPKCTKN